MDRSDPTSGFTDMQWYMHRQRNVAFFAAFTDHAFSDEELLAVTRGLLALAPQLGTGFVGGSAAAPIPDTVLRCLIYRESVSSLEGFPERWLERGDAVFSDPAMPLFRIRHAALDRTTIEGPRGFLLVQVAHALVEGADSALLSRSQSAAHPLTVGARRPSPLVKAAATGLGAVLTVVHLLAGNLVTVHPGPFGFATRAYPRLLFSRLARDFGVRQRALFFALVMHTLFNAGTATGNGKITSTYSVIDDGGGPGRDTYMRMRMRFARFANAPTLPDFVRAVDRRLLQSEGRESGFNDEMNARAIRLHRTLSHLLPFAYTPKLFQFMPYDVVLGLIPPHRLGGGLTAGLIEPVYAGAALEGANACVIVPGRRQVSFNFYIQQRLLPCVARLDAVLAPSLISHSETGV